MFVPPLVFLIIGYLEQLIYHEISVSTVQRLRRRFVEESFEVALYGKKREPVREKLLDGRVEARLIALRCSDPPQGYARWTLRLLADQMVALIYPMRVCGGF